MINFLKHIDFRAILSSPILYRAFQFFNGAGHMRRVITNEFIKPSKNMSILDIGCGTADILPYLKDCEYTGIDMSPRYIEFSRKRFVNRDNTQFFCSDVNDFLKMNQTKFDIVLFLGVMHHLDDKALYNCLKDLGSLLKPSGTIITMDGAFTDDLNRFEAFLLKSDRGQYVRSKTEWIEFFSKFCSSYDYVIKKDLYFLPYNLIFFYNTKFNNLNEVPPIE